MLNIAEEIKRIEGLGVAGNYHSDSTIWAEMEAIILDETLPREVRVAAQRKVGQIIGDPEIVSLEEHVEELKKCR